MRRRWDNSRMICHVNLVGRGLSAVLVLVLAQLMLYRVMWVSDWSAGQPRVWDQEQEVLVLANLSKRENAAVRNRLSPGDVEVLAAPEDRGDFQVIVTSSSSSSSEANLTASRIVWLSWATLELPESARAAWDRTKKKNPEYEFRLMDDASIDDFMQKHFSGATIAAFQSLNPKLGAMRADFWRYCVLYLNGGVYADVDAAIQTPLTQWVNDTAILSFERNKWSTYKNCCCEKVWSHLNMTFPDMTIRGPNNRDVNVFLQWLMVFPTPRHPILLETIRLVTELISRWEDTPQTQELPAPHKVICLTGPVVFSIAVQNSWNAVGQDWNKLNVRLDDFDYKGKARRKMRKIAADMSRAKTRYANMGTNVSIKTTQK